MIRKKFLICIAFIKIQAYYRILELFTKIAALEKSFSTAPMKRKAKFEKILIVVNEILVIFARSSVHSNFFRVAEENGSTTLFLFERRRVIFAFKDTIVLTFIRRYLYEKFEDYRSVFQRKNIFHHTFTYYQGHIHRVHTTRDFSIYQPTLFCLYLPRTKSRDTKFVLFFFNIIIKTGLLENRYLCVITFSPHNDSANV